MRESHCSDHSLNGEISVVNNLLSFVTLTSPDNSRCALLPLPTLPFDLVEEILRRLSVKLLCQLRCICKSWNSLITDPKFAKKHLSHSTTHCIHFLRYSTGHPPTPLLTSYPLDSLFTNELEVTGDVTQLDYARDRYLYYSFTGSCNGILCIVDNHERFILLCNPSLRKFKKLPQLMSHVQTMSINQASYGFGYDHVNDNYKVVVVLKYVISVSMPLEINGNDEIKGNDDIKRFKTEVNVYTLGTDCWKNIGEFPFDGIPAEFSGKFVSGTINWLACKDLYYNRGPCFIVSFDLENESFQEVPMLDYGNVYEIFVILGVLRDCLCVICGHDIWLMKEYGNKESWTKLFTVSLSYMRDPSKSYYLDKAIYIFEDDQVLLESRGDLDLELIVYDPKINTFKFIKFQNKSVYNSMFHGREICVESLILPW